MATAFKKPTPASVPAAPKAAAKPTSDKPQGLKVVPKRAGFRRAGHTFPDGDTTIALAEITEDQYNALISEPMLVTMLVDLPEAGAATA
ncbi:MAG: HI1506-related protein [Rhodoferax sp.]|nr:HI1506-related protein [Rhodoferax sp.]